MSDPLRTLAERARVEVVACAECQGTGRCLSKGTVIDEFRYGDRIPRKQMQACRTCGLPKGKGTWDKSWGVDEDATAEAIASRLTALEEVAKAAEGDVEQREGYCIELSLNAGLSDEEFEELSVWLMDKYGPERLFGVSGHPQSGHSWRTAQALTNLNP